MRILFLMKVFEVGGIETVTNILANQFITQGHKVCIVSFEFPSSIMLDRKDDQIKMHVLNGYFNSKENVKKLRKIFIEEQTQIVINQWGLPFLPIKLARLAGKSLDINYISIYHNNPSENARLQDIQIKLNNTTNIIKRNILYLKKILYKEITRQSMCYVYRKSHYFILLSSSFVKEFKSFTHIHKLLKLKVITNPVTTNNLNYHFNFSEKKKEIIYVGRIDYNQKRVKRIIDTWKLLEAKYPDWKLTIVGDGEEKKNLESLVLELKLKRVTFEGFQDPAIYYRRASILLLTSEYEGFPLVLAEAMSFAVIPIVYGSFPSVYDIISHGVNGFVYSDSKYREFKMAQYLERIMGNNLLHQTLAKNALEASKLYSMENIYFKWINLFDEIYSQSK